MIVEMHRVLVFGPKRLLGVVLGEVQRLGVLHVDRIEAEETALTAMGLDEREAVQQAALERLRIRIEGLMNLLPEVPDGRPAEGEDLEAASVETLDAATTGIESEVQDLSRRRLEIQEETELIRTFEGAVRVLAPLQNALAGSRSFKTVGFILRSKDLTVVAALRNQLTEMTGGRVEVVSRVVEEGKIGVVVAFLHRDEETITRFLTQAGISELRLPDRYGSMGPMEAVKLMEQRRAALPVELAAVRNALAVAARRHRGNVLALRSLVADRLSRLSVLPNLAQSRYTFVLHGWAPAARMTEVRAALHGRFGNDVIVYDAPADPHDAAQVPVLLDNPSVLRPFQRMLGLFRPPRYGTLDPTIYMAIFFPVFVGIVIGDVGYGLLLFSIGWWWRNKARRGETLVIPGMNMKLAPNVLGDLSWIIRVMATWSILFGVFYLEVFGNLVELHSTLRPYFDRLVLTESFLKFTLALGVVQVMLGYVLHLLLALRHRHTVGILESFAMIFGVSALLLWLGTSNDYLPPSLGRFTLALAGAAGVFVVVGTVMRWTNFMWAIEAVSGLGNILSYARLYGVGLAAAILANTSNELGGGFGPVWVGVIAGLFIQMFFLVFTVAGHIIQPARLNWVEFLTKIKYHDETGHSYRPLHKTGGDLG